MKRPICGIVVGALACALMTAPQGAAAQGYGTPLSFQGLNHTTNSSPAMRGAGGISFGLTNDVTMMFANPASLTTLEGPQAAVVSMSRGSYFKQEQYFGALQTHSAFSLLVEGTTGGLPDPDTTQPGVTPPVNQSDSVQRPFDALGPNWNRTRSSKLPFEAFVAVPFELAGMRIVAGAGIVEYADLDGYYQNNNSFSPSVLSVLDGTIRTTGLNTDPYLVQWYQLTQQRDGAINGYGASVAAVLSDRLSLGVSGMLLSGTTDDREARVGRGRMEFFATSLRLSKQNMSNATSSGTSDFSGQEFTLSARYASPRFVIGFSLTPPTTITRKFNLQIASDSVVVVSLLSHRVDSVHSVTSSSVSGTDKMSLPLRGTVGMAVHIRDNLVFAVGYELLPYAGAQYEAQGAAKTSPWLSSAILHVGADYRASSWLTLRCGVTNYTDVFQPVANALRGDPVSYPVYAVGCGIAFAGAHFSATYEYSDMKYVDTWSNAASINRQINNTIAASVSYDLPAFQGSDQ